MDVLVLIDKLDDLVHNAKAVPLTDQVRIDREEIYDILDQMRATIPEEIKQARWIVKERQEMLAEAKRECDRILGEAREQAVREASQTEIVKLAERLRRCLWIGHAVRARDDAVVPRDEEHVLHRSSDVHRKATALRRDRDGEGAGADVVAGIDDTGRALLGLVALDHDEGPRLLVDCASCESASIEDPVADVARHGPVGVATPVALAGDG